VAVAGSEDHGAEVRINGEPAHVVGFVFSTTVAYGEDGTMVLEITARDFAGNTALVTRAAQ